MSVREEDRQRNSCPSRGLGLAAAAIGVGVGAAMYYFFSEGPENPGREGSTSGWTCEEPHAFNPLHGHDDSETYISGSYPLRGHDDSETTNTSINSTDTPESSEEFESVVEIESNDHGSVEQDQSSEWDNNSQIDNSHVSISSDDSSNIGYLPSPVVTVINVSSDSDTMDWEVTSSSIDVPRYEGRSPRSPLMSLLNNFGASVSSRPGIRRQIRERSWSLEECSICFDIMLKDQQVTTLPCTHNFHSACITPWLQEQQTCPNCREAVE